jgi:Flp pilus assembly protein TadD
MAQQQSSTPSGAQRLINGESLNQILGVTNTQEQALAVIGFNFFRQGKVAEAETIFRGLAAVDGKAYYGYAGLGAVALAKQPPDLKTAYENLTKAAELNPNDPSVQANLGEVLLRAGKIEEAKTPLARAFQLDPGHNDAGANRARAMVGGLDMIVKQIESRLQAQKSPGKSH